MGTISPSAANAPALHRAIRRAHAGDADDAVDTVVQSDLAVVCDPAKLDERGDAPDGMVEALSPATAGQDHVLMRAVYERARAREYRLVHAVDHTATVYRPHDGHFGVSGVLEFTGRQAVGALAQVEIDWKPNTALTAD